MRARGLLLAAAMGIAPMPLLAQAGPPVAELGRIVVLSDGRTMPLDSLARLAVGQISGARSAGGQDPMEWIGRVLFDPASTLDDPVFFVGHPDTPAALGLGSIGRGRYSLRQLQPGLARLDALAAQISRRGGASDAVEADVLRLKAAVDLYVSVSGALDFARAGRQGSSAVYRGRPDLLKLWTRGTDNPLKVIPAKGTWLSPDSAIVAGGDSARLAGLLAAALDDWTRRDWNGVRQEIQAFAAAAQPWEPAASALASLEVFYNRARPFLFASLLALLSCLLWPAGLRVPWLRRASLMALTAAVLLQAAGLAARVVITGRPPVTSLYSSFLFVALLMLVLGLVFSARGKERLWPVIGPLGAILVTALSSRFALQGDQLGVLQAVLDTNFWLATHVVAISTGYTGALATGLIGHAWIIRKIVRPSDEQGLAHTERVLTRTLLVALLFTFLGTILGGIWADQSWGRFWGWDPKENGALLIIIWMAILQHARLARLIGAQGLAVGSVFLVVVVMFSWLGVNLMGVGLHSYGWTQGVGAILLAVGVFETLFMVLGSALARMRERPMEGLRTVRVESITRETPDAVTVRLAANPSHRILGEPGRFLTLFARIDGMTYRRAYSLSSVSPTGLHAEITVKRVEGGRVSSWIVDSLRPGARLTVGGPGGKFGLNGAGHAGNGARHPHNGSARSGNVGDAGAAARLTQAVFVATGSGIAPLAPMAEQLLKTGAPLLLLYGSRDEKSIIFKERLHSLARSYPGLTVRHVLSDPSSTWTGDRGWIDGELVLRAAPPREGREFYLCGPSELVDSVREALVAAGVPEASIHQERFLPGSSGAARRASRGAVVRFLRTGREVRVLPGQSILEAGLRGGLTLPYGCAAGQCRECAARLTSGRVTMEETSPLTSAERDNNVVLTCISYPDGDCELDL